MNTDRELLEAAAKATGVDGECRTENLCHDGDWSDMTVIFLADDEGWWGPLHDDGDALRLAVKLGIDVSHNTFGNVIADHYTLPQKQAVVLAHGIDPCAATRRAIVSLAAKLPALRVVGAV